MKVGPATVSKLDELVATRSSLLQKIAKLNGEVKECDAEISRLVTKYELPNKSGKSESIILPGGGQVRVTRPSYSPTVNPGRLRDNLKKRLGEDGGNAVFLKVVSIDKVTLNVDEWERAIDDELVLPSDLTTALDQRDPPKPSVVVKGPVDDPSS